MPTTQEKNTSIFRGIWQRFSGGTAKTLQQWITDVKRDNPDGTDPIDVSYGNLTPVEVVRQYLDEVRASSRNEYRGNPMVKRAANHFVESIVGKGAALVRDWSVPIEALTPDVQERLHLEWRRHVSYMDYRERLKTDEFVKLVVRSFLVDGEFIGRWTMDAEGRRRIAPIDAATVPSRFTDKENKQGERHVCGIEFDDSGRRTRYFIEKLDDNLGAGYGNTIKAVGYPAEEFVHLMEEEFVNQPRGWPFFSASIPTFQNLRKYDAIHMQSAKNRARFLWTLNPRNPERYEHMDAIEGIPAAAWKHEDPTVPWRSFLKNAQTGKTVILPPNGYELKAEGLRAPDSEYGPFLEAQQRLALGSYYSQVMGRFDGLNYVSARLQRLFDRELLEGLQRKLVERIYRPMYENFIDLFLLRNSLPRELTREALLSAFVFKSRAFEYLSPKETAEANALELANGTKLVSQIIEDTGISYEEFLRAQERQGRMQNDILGSVREDAPPVERQADGEDGEDDGQP